MEKYKEMYAYLFGEVTKAINILITAQKNCEEMFIKEDAEIIPFQKEKPHKREL